MQCTYEANFIILYCFDRERLVDNHFGCYSRLGSTIRNTPEVQGSARRNSSGRCHACRHDIFLRRSLSRATDTRYVYRGTFVSTVTYAAGLCGHRVSSYTVRSALSGIGAAKEGIPLHEAWLLWTGENSVLSEDEIEYLRNCQASRKTVKKF